MNNNLINIAALQLNTLPFDSGKLDYYLTIAKSKKCKVVLLGEYILNLFFKELEKTPINLIKDQTKHHLLSLKQMAKVYNIVIVAPVVVVEKNLLKKEIKVFTPTGVRSYEQQILMSYPHWNEEKFFQNRQELLKNPLIFKIDEFKFSVLAGYEVHYDFFWNQMVNKKVDCVLLPTASTFESQVRWREVIKTRSFLNHIYILRSNRIGVYNSKESDWVFYGDTLLCDPYGDVEDFLGEKEEILVVTIDKNLIKQAKRDWKFQNIVNSRSI